MNPSDRKASGAKGQRTRDAMIDVALQVFSLKGIANTAVIDITKQMGLRNSNFYYYFTNLDELIQTVGRRIVLEIIKTLDRMEQWDPAARVAYGTLRILQFADKNSELRPIVLRVLEDVNKENLDLSDDLRNNLEYGRRAGRFSFPDLNVSARFYNTLLASAVKMKIEGNEDVGLNAATALLFLQMIGLSSDEAERVTRQEQEHIEAT